MYIIVTVIITVVIITRNAVFKSHSGETVAAATWRGGPQMHRRREKSLYTAQQHSYIEK